MTRYLILGNGAAGATAAEVVRQRDARGEITLLSPEPHPMYSRPGLAYVLLNEVPAKQIYARTPEWYAQHHLQRVQGAATQLDVDAHTVTLANGQVLPYDRLLIATGARAAPLPYPGAELDGVVYLDTFDSTMHLLQHLKRAKRAVVVGGGITALEMAEGFAHHHVETHYLVRRDALWSVVLNAEESQWLDKHMRAHHIQIHYNTEIAEVQGDNKHRGDKKRRVTGVRLNTGATLPCEVVGAGIGVKAEIEWVRSSTLKVERGIVANEFLETSAPDVYAAGDCAQTWDPWAKKHVQDVLWPTAIAQGQVAGANLTGARETYVKGSPFNACLLFGLHLTAMGQLGGSRNDEADIVQHTLGRGTSELWNVRAHSYASAWEAQSENRVRLALSEDELVGALVIGEQTLADPLRALIDQRINIASIKPALQAGGPALIEAVTALWQAECRR